MTRTRVSRKGARALWKAGKAHKFSRAEALRHGTAFDSDRGRAAALKRWAGRTASPPPRFREVVEEMEARYTRRGSDGEDEEDEET